MRQSGLDVLMRGQPQMGSCRDLKLDNTLLDDSGPPRVKLCDFGFAKAFEKADANMFTLIGWDLRKRRRPHHLKHRCRLPPPPPPPAQDMGQIRGLPCAFREMGRSFFNFLQHASLLLASDGGQHSSC